MLSEFEVKLIIINNQLLNTIISFSLRKMFINSGYKFIVKPCTIASASFVASSLNPFSEVFDMLDRILRIFLMATLECPFA
jgi:hypothetical protein